jgi:exodeoxyribonuclease V alpha subunit
VENSREDKITKVLESLKQSRFRAQFVLKPEDRDYVQDKGIDVIRTHAVDFITKRLGPARPANDGRQTPMKKHPVFIAQHATATCCRGCLEKWHFIPAGEPLTGDQIEYIVQVIMIWIGRSMEKE